MAQLKYNWRKPIYLRTWLTLPVSEFQGNGKRTSELNSPIESRGSTTFWGSINLLSPIIRWTLLGFLIASVSTTVFYLQLLVRNQPFVSFIFPELTIVGVGVVASFVSLLLLTLLSELEKASLRHTKQTIFDSLLTNMRPRLKTTQKNGFTMSGHL